MPVIDETINITLNLTILGTGVILEIPIRILVEHVWKIEPANPDRGSRVSLRTIPCKGIEESGKFRADFVWRVTYPPSIQVAQYALPRISWTWDIIHVLESACCSASRSYILVRPGDQWTYKKVQQRGADWVPSEEPEEIPGFPSGEKPSFDDPGSVGAE